MNIDNTESQFKFWTTEVSAALQTGLPYNLREMASVGPTGLQNVSDTFGAALWTLNFFCYAATLNISSVQLHMTDNSFAAPWQPGKMNNMGPHIRPSYYAFAAFAQLLGSNGTTQISALSLDSKRSFVRAYAAYSDETLSSLILINSVQANASATSKPNLTVSVSLPDYAGQTLYLSYLTADGADSLSNTTWNGISFEQDSVGTPSGGDQDPQGVTIGTDGVATINVRNSEAVIARLGLPIGSDSVASPDPSTSSSAGSTASGTASSSGSKTSSTSAAASSSSAVSAATPRASGSLFTIFLIILVLVPTVLWAFHF